MPSPPPTMFVIPGGIWLPFKCYSQGNGHLHPYLHRFLGSLSISISLGQHSGTCSGTSIGGHHWWCRRYWHLHQCPFPPCSEVAEAPGFIHCFLPPDLPLTLLPTSQLQLKHHDWQGSDCFRFNNKLTPCSSPEHQCPSITVPSFPFHPRTPLPWTTCFWSMIL